jgi:hypothetical protein
VGPLTDSPPLPIIARTLLWQGAKNKNKDINEGNLKKKSFRQAHPGFGPINKQKLEKKAKENEK